MSNEALAKRYAPNWDWLLSVSGIMLAAYCVINLHRGAQIRPLVAISEVLMTTSAFDGWQIVMVVSGFLLLLGVFIGHIWVGMHYPQHVYNNRMMLHRQLSGSIQWPALIWTVQMITGLMLIPLCGLYLMTLLLPIYTEASPWLVDAARAEGWVVYCGILPLFALHTMMGLIRIPAKYWLKGYLRMAYGRIIVLSAGLAISMALLLTRMIG